MVTTDFPRTRLDAMIDLRHHLAVLATRMPWAQIESNLTPVFARCDRAGRAIKGADLFGLTMALADTGISQAGRTRLSMRLMVALLYLKYAYNLSNDAVIERWAQDVYFQFFSCQEYFEARFPCDKAQLSRFRRGLGEAGVEEFLKTTIEASVAMGAVKKAELERVILGARTFSGNPHNGHTLAEQIKQTTCLLQDLKVKPTKAIVDLGYRGVDHLVVAQVIDRGRFKTVSARQRKWLKRRQAVEPVIGHLKADRRMGRCWLKGKEGDAVHTVLCAAGFNLRWLLRAIARCRLKAVYLCLIWLTTTVVAAAKWAADHQRNNDFRPAHAVG